ncbi:hypothetical protein, partial [Lacticaseibacillus rhamnosus]|uniref:hypothetical protein n=1 Tax=Lacticaseibacillus rhamnosus TaxID=47715 RepID=UPI001EE736E9
ITTDAWRNSLDHYQEFVIIVALDLKIEEAKKYPKILISSKTRENNIFFSFKRIYLSYFDGPSPNFSGKKYRLNLR